MSPPLQGQLGRYTIVGLIEEGGMAEVYLARTAGGDPVVIKRVKPALRRQPRYRALFEQEARLMSGLAHPNIVPVLELVAEPEGELYVVMPFVDGNSLLTLRERLPDHRLPWKLVAQVGRDIGSALAFAHGFRRPDGRELLLVHRDVSPHNILLGRHGEVMLTDFGVAKPMHKDTDGDLKGKVAYMAPEQLGRKPRADHRTDLFALGVVLYEALTGQRPYDAPTSLLLAARLAQEGVPAAPVASLNREVPQALGVIVDRAVRLSPRERYQTGVELEAEMSRLLREVTGLSGAEFARLFDAASEPRPVSSVVTDVVRPMRTQVEHRALPTAPQPKTQLEPFPRGAGDREEGVVPVALPVARPDARGLPRWLVQWLVVIGVLALAAAAGLGIGTLAARIRDVRHSEAAGR